MDIDTSKSLNNSVLTCGICGENHKCTQCNVIEITRHIPDNVIPPKAHLTLPNSVNITAMADGSSCVITKSPIEKGARFGPLEAQTLLTLNPSVTFPLKVFNDTVEELSEYYLDTSDESKCNWMMFVQPAQNMNEQNLICFQEKNKIYYVALRDIGTGEFLKVWYAPYYARRMKKNILTPICIEDEYANNTMNECQPVDLNELMKKQQKIMERDNWTCKFCGKLENNVPQFATHILDHYYQYRRFKKHCDICKQSFSTQRMLRKHLKSAHSKENDNLKKSKIVEELGIDKVRNKDALVGGPLLNDLLNDSIDNTNLVMPSIELNQLVIPLTNTLENQAILLEGDSLSLNVDNLLTENVKELDHFNFELGESQEQHVCDVCLKSFLRLDYLIQHLKKHTGKFTCRFCLKIFCRAENLQSHKCSNNNVLPQFTCSLCQRGFMLKKYLKRHMNSVHDKKYTCENCDRKYHSNKEYKEHNCSAIPNAQKQTFTCVTCGKTFFREVYLKRHMKVHLSKVRTMPLSKDLICECCAQQFTTARGLHLHNKIHSDRTAECEICNKKFYRGDVLKTHMLTHGEAKVTCTVCDTKFRTKQTLAIHMLQHTGIKPHSCKMCLQKFYQRSNLTKHYTKVHLKTCHICKKSFETMELLEKHKSSHLLKEFFVCPLCNKNLKLRSSLRRHLKTFHTDNDSETIMTSIKPKKTNFKENLEKQEYEKLTKDATVDEMYSMKSENNKTQINSNTKSTTESEENFQNIVDNFENILNSYNTNSNVNLLNTYEEPDRNVSNSSRILDFSDLKMDLSNNFESQGNENNREICLSMPDLMEPDEEIILNENMYMLEDGTIVEQKDQGNLLVYILGKNF